MKHRVVMMLAAVLAVLTVRASAEEGVPAARELYAAAEYEDALVLLDHLRATDQRADDALIQQYRAFCLMALGRPEDAELAMRAVISAKPLYRVSDADASPRIRSAFSEVRRKMLPGIIQEQYAAAKAAFDRKDEGAAARFDQVLRLLADPDVSAEASRPPLSDVRTLAAGFRDLSTVATPPPLPTSRVEAVGVPAPIAAQPANVISQSVGNRTYGAEDQDVVPPVIIRQNLPPFRFQASVTPNRGLVDVVIDQTGRVVDAVIRKSVSPLYDGVMIEQAHTWRYKPATLHGVPVTYRKVLVVNVTR